MAVLSAMLGVTNRLIDAANCSAQGRMSAVRDIRQFLRVMHASTLDGEAFLRSVDLPARSSQRCRIPILRARSRPQHPEGYCQPSGHVICSAL